MSTREFTAIIGNGVDAVIDVDHRKKSKTGHVAIRDVATDEQIGPTEYAVAFPTDDSLRLTFAQPPAANSLEVTFTAASSEPITGTALRTAEFTKLIGNGRDARILVTHRKHAKTGHVSIRDVATDEQLGPTEFDVKFPGPDTLVVTFAVPPQLNSLELTFTAAVPAAILSLGPCSGEAPALTLLSRGLDFITAQFGATAFILHQPADGPVIGAFVGQWNDLGRHEEVTLNGKRVFFSVIVECGRAQFAELPKEGQIVIRSADGFTGRIVGKVDSDALTVRFPLDTRHK